MKKIILLSCVLLANILSSRAQLLPANQPEQEPCNALEICGNFFTPYSYQEVGLSNDLPSTSCGAGEDNSVWFKLTVTTGGNLVFKIVPELVTDDYDWALLDATGISCGSLSSSDVIRCNFNQNVPVTAEGQTGLNMTSIETSVYAGTTGHNFCRYVEVEEGEVYYLMINNFGIGGTPTSGFTLDFAGSTATLNQPPAPELEEILTSNCDITNQLRVQLTEKVKCSSIAADGSDFSITPSGTITGAEGVDCSEGGYTDEIILTFSDDLAPGSYTLHAATGTDDNTLLNLCDIPLELPDNLTFQVYPLKDTVDVEICSDMLPYIWNGITVTSGGDGVASYTAENAHGCDSNTVLNLNIVDTVTVYIYDTICTNQLPYTWNGFTLTEGGSPAASYFTTSSGGCDSMTHLFLTVTPPKWATESLELCSYELPYEWNGTTIPAGSSSHAHYDTFGMTTATGCDSFTILDLTVFEITPVTSTADTHACGSLEFKGHIYKSDTVLSDTFRAVSGCDSAYVNFNVFVHYNQATVKTNALNGCDSLLFRGEYYFEDTTIVDSFKSIWGCDSFVVLNDLKVQHFELDLISNTDTIVAGEYLVLNASAGHSFGVDLWTPAEYFINQHTKEQVFRPQVTNFYTVQGTSEYGCVDSGGAWVVVLPLVPDLMMPNAFSPNGDGLNDLFAPKFFHETGYIINQFLIYNRWGNLVYKLDNSRIDGKGWNGYNQKTGQIADQDVYFYYIEVEFVNGQKVTRKGDVTLIK